MIVDCSDYSLVKEILKNSRKIDDNIINILNTTATVDHKDYKYEEINKKCMNLISQLDKVYKQRGEIINGCITFYKKEIQSLNSQLSSASDGDDGDDAAVERTEQKLLVEEGKLRQLKNEQVVEDILRDKTINEFKKRCRGVQISFDYKN
ncbi:hypothetical protein MP228_006641 [Amoeboaphelidium protococcarum]|nr:hypothetical protein MP228_006641 [Amoeboaphelidium protococcarum]